MTPRAAADRAGPRGPAPADVFVALGSNLGEREATLRAALSDLESLPGATLIGVSTFRQTAPVGPIDQPPFLNAVVHLAYRGEPRGLLRACLDIERRHGRRRAGVERWGPRTLDLDILLFGDLVVREPDLTLPHPRLRERLFVLGPLAELAPDLALPPDGERVREVFESLRRSAGA